MKKEDFNTDDLVEFLFEADPNYIEEIKNIEHRFNCNISFDIEKHHALQFTYYYEIDYGLKEMFFVEIESGINNGTQINNEAWDYNTKPESRTIKVLKDVVLDPYFYPKGSFIERKAQAVLTANKGKLFDFHRQNSYDNYVTGGNSKMKLDPLLSKLHLSWVYEEEEVGCNFV